MGEIFANVMSDEVLISKIYEEFIQLSMKKIIQPDLKWAKDLNKEDIQMDTST